MLCMERSILLYTYAGGPLLKILLTQAISSRACVCMLRENEPVCQSTGGVSKGTIDYVIGDVLVYVHVVYKTSLNFISAIGTSIVNSAYYNKKLFTVVLIMQCVANTDIATLLVSMYHLYCSILSVMYISNLNCELLSSLKPTTFNQIQWFRANCWGDSGYGWW